MVDFSKIKLVVFDVDGTLYDLKKVHRKILWQIIKYLLSNPLGFHKILILLKFRKERKKLEGLFIHDLDRKQYEIIGSRIGCDVEKIKEIVEEWMIFKPLKYLAKNKFFGLDEFISFLKKYNIKFTFLSDYPVKDKLAVLKINSVDFYYAGDREINCFKPSVLGINYILNKHGLMAEECAIIGDSQRLDGLIAQKIGSQFFLIDDKDFYYNLLKS